MFFGRPIDAAFPQYKQLEYDNNAVTNSGVDSGFAAFVRGYFGAWLSNKEFSFNGLQPPGSDPTKPNQDDLAAFEQFVMLWNRAHSNSSTYTINPSPNGFNDTLRQLADPTEHIYYYVQILVNEAATSRYSGILDQGQRTLTINTGPSPAVAPVSGTPSSATKTSSAAKIAGGTVVATGVAMAAIGVYAIATKQPIAAVFSKSWNAVRSKIHLPHFRKLRGRRLHENPALPSYDVPRLKAKTKTNNPIAFRVRLDVSPAYEVVILGSDGTATLFRYRYPIVRFKPLPYQLSKIRHARGDIVIYTNQIVETLINR